MKIIITENQLIKLLEQPDSRFGPERYIPLNKRLGGATEKDWERAGQMEKDFNQSIIQLRQKYPNTFDFVASYGLWLIPFIGPYLSAAYSGVMAVKKIKKGDYVNGVIELITSPLVIGKLLKIAPHINIDSKTIEVLTKINKSGIPVIYAQGQSEFLKWGYKNFGDDFKYFLDLLNNKDKMKKILSYIKDDMVKNKKIINNKN